MALEKSVKVDFLKSGTGVAFGKIKDSGDRTEFATGAVRDMREGKGRCDLMPLEVASHMFENNGRDDQVLALIRMFQKTGSTYALYTALDEFKMCAYDDTKTMLLEVAKHFEDGAKKYGESNWQKGIPVHCYIDSAVRHYLKWLRGDKDEPHDRAFVWNLMCCIWEVDYSPRAEEESDPKKLQEKAQEILREMGDEPIEAKLLPVTKAAEPARLGDCIAGLFEFDGVVYMKVNTLVVPNFYVNVLTGTIKQFHPDILVTPLEIWEVDGDEDE